MNNFYKKLQVILNELLTKEAPEAPVKPSPVKPSPAKPSRPSPFKPPKPAVVPKPKARSKEELTEAYEDEIDPSVLAFWSDIKNPELSKHHFSKHPVLAMHGDKLSKSAYEYVSDGDIREMQTVFNQILRVERRHKSELEVLAKRVVSQIWGIDESMLDGKLEMPKNEGNEEGGELTSSSLEKDDDVDQETRDEINKRITTNAMTHGASIHQMASAHHLINKELDAIDKNLLKLYTKLAKTSVKNYWLIDFSQMIDLAGYKVGEEYIDWLPSKADGIGEGEDGSEDEIEDTAVEDSGATVVARGIVFPVLIQELSKGVMELLMMHGYAKLDPKVQEKLQTHADVLTDEPWLIQIGPELWRRFLKVIPKGANISELIAAFGELKPKQIHKIIDAVIDEPEHASELLNQAIGPNKFPEDGSFEDLEDKWPA